MEALSRAGYRGWATPPIPHAERHSEGDGHAPETIEMFEAFVCPTNQVVNVDEC